MSTKTETFVFPRPISPTKEDLRPNAHPYPIRTTMTGALSRSNSNSSPHVGGGGHHYVPSPSPSPSRSNSGRMSGHGHRYSRSQSSDGPRPLPIPPQSPSGNPVSAYAELPDRVEASSSPRRLNRQDSLPTLPGGVDLQRLPALDELPSNPKAWTPSQLSLYLSTTLRVKSGETLQLPAPVAQDIANFVKDSKITGRRFLRMKEDDLAQFEINKLWRSALLSASRSLRQSVLKGRIWGFGSAIEEVPCSPVSTSASEDEGTPHRRTRSTSLHETHSDNPFINGSASSSTESLGDGTPVRRNATRDSRVLGRYRNGRVKGMVETFERSGSVDEGMPEWGQVRRERSNSSASSASGGSLYETADPEDTEPDYANATARPSSSRPLPVPPSDSSAFTASGDEELSMEELLQQTGIYPTSLKSPSAEPETFVSKRRSKPRGVHAWEAEAEGTMDRVTVKRVMPIPGTGIEDLFALAPIVASPSPSKVDASVEPMILVSPLDEAKLEEELEETKRMVAALRKRVEDVERKVDDMEERELENEREEEKKRLKEQYKKEEEEKKREAELQVEPAPAPTPPALFPPGSIVGRVFAAVFGTHAATNVQNKFMRSTFYDRLVEPTTISGLPSYVLLVGLGVCAVVLKVLMRKGSTLAFLARRR